MIAHRLLCTSLVALALAPSGCAATSNARAPSAAVADAPPPPLEHSLFARDPGGQLDEPALQKILESPIEVSLPARVGVLPILPASDWRGPAPSTGVPAGTHAFAHALGGSEPFPLVSEVMAIPSGALGMEALREIAARYRLRYLVLYRVDVEREQRSNGLAALYATVLGAFFIPGQTLAAHGYVEASLFDVKTGTLMYTVRRPVAARRTSNVWHQDDKLAALEAGLAEDSAADLARDVRAATARYVEAARAEARQLASRITTP